jgi:hypothetical protein
MLVSCENETRTIFLKMSSLRFVRTGRRTPLRRKRRQNKQAYNDDLEKLRKKYPNPLEWPERQMQFRRLRWEYGYPPPNQNQDPFLL